MAGDKYGLNSQAGIYSPKLPSIRFLIAIMEIDRDIVGYHLRILVTEDVLHARKKGRYTVYTVNGKR